MRIMMRLLFEAGGQLSRALQRLVELVNPKEQQQSITRRRIGSGKRRMLMGAPLMKAKQNRPVCIKDHSEVVMGRRRLWKGKQGQIPSEAAGDIRYSDNGPKAIQLGLHHPSLPSPSS